jgi:hypothetical protein
MSAARAMDASPGTSVGPAMRSSQVLLASLVLFAGLAI